MIGRYAAKADWKSALHLLAKAGWKPALHSAGTSCSLPGFSHPGLACRFCRIGWQRRCRGLFLKSDEQSVSRFS